jgi:hypothetical protein
MTTGVIVALAILATVVLVALRLYQLSRERERRFEAQRREWRQRVLRSHAAAAWLIDDTIIDAQTVMVPFEDER